MSEGNPSHSSAPIVIDYDRFMADRRISRPPGVPTLWSRPSNQMHRAPALTAPSSPQPSASNILPTTKPRSARQNLSVDHSKELHAADSQPQDLHHIHPPRPLHKRGSSQPIKQVERTPATLSSKQEWIRKQIPPALEPNYHARKEAVSKPNDPQRLSRPVKALPSTNMKPETTRPVVRSMTIEELQARHKEALKKMQQRATENHDPIIDKAQLRKKYEEEVEQLRARMKLDQAQHRMDDVRRSPRSSTLPMGLDPSSSVHTTGSSHKRPGGIMEGSSRNSSNQSKRNTWLNF